MRHSVMAMEQSRDYRSVGGRPSAANVYIAAVLVEAVGCARVRQSVGKVENAAARTGPKAKRYLRYAYFP